MLSPSERRYTQGSDLVRVYPRCSTAAWMRWTIQLENLAGVRGVFHTFGDAHVESLGQVRMAEGFGNGGLVYVQAVPRRKCKEDPDWSDLGNRRKGLAEVNIWPLRVILCGKTDLVTCDLIHFI